MASPQPLTKENVVFGFQNCDAHAKRRLRDFLPELPFQLPKYREPARTFVSGAVKNSLLTEAHLYLDRAIYLLAAYKSLIVTMKFTWAQATLYQADYYVISTLIRLQGKTPVYQGGRYFLVFSNNLTREEYHILDEGTSSGSHQRLWELFYDLYADFSYERQEYDRICSPPSHEIRAGLQRRNVIHYEPEEYERTKPFEEFIMAASECRRRRSTMLKDVFENYEKSYKDDDLGWELRTAMRIKLACRLLKEIAKISSFQTYHERHFRRRRDFLAIHAEPKHLGSRLAGWLA